MNGAEKLLETLINNGVEICFANPGTSEMQLVSAIGDSDGMRPVLCLFEGVVSGAADGYARMKDKPAATLLHVGSGFSNSMANQHNAKRAHVPLVNIVGDHATYHLQYDSPLTADVPAHAAICSDWVKVSASADDLGDAGAEAIQAAMTGAGKIATLIAPANHAWEETTEAAISLPLPTAEIVSSDTITEVSKALSNGKASALFLGSRALREDSLNSAGRIAEKTGVRIICETFPTRLQRGAGRVAVERLPYFAEQAEEFLKGFEQLIFVGAKPPVAFFAYPGKKSWLIDESCKLITLATVDQDQKSALEAVADQLSTTAIPTTTPPLPEEVRVAATQGPVATGDLTPLAMSQSISTLMPANAIISDEAATCGMTLFPATMNAPAHDWLTLTGGAIGQGLPLSLGASLACPDRKVIALQADGSAMYTVQALWSMARENVDVTVVILNNRSYAILNIELARVGAGKPTAKTLSMLDLSRPDMNWVEISTGMGVPASRATSAEEFHQQFAQAMATKGPHLIEAMVVQQMP
ncbi:MAG: acetolactate synthase large subunit [Proteobacteria bacterium]|nr:acetolactate synthase large subunit [Pseudomonadota bacterium]